MVRLLNLKLQQALKKQLTALGIIHYVNNFYPYQLVGTSVGEGTFGKVKLGKHILTGEKVWNDLNSIWI